MEDTVEHGRGQDDVAGEGLVPAALSADARSARADLDRPFVICDGAIQLTDGLEGAATAIVSCGVPRVDLDRFGVVRDGFADFPLGAMRKRPIVVGVGVLGGYLDCLGEICDRAIVVTLGLAGA